MWFTFDARGFGHYYHIFIYIVLFTTNLKSPIEAKPNSDHEKGMACVSPRRVKRDDLSVLPYDDVYSSDYSRQGYAAYFSGKEIVRFERARISTEAFTVEMWVRPEGGQYSSVPLITFFNRCNHDNDTKGWALGLEEAKKEQDLRVYFALESDRSKKRTTILSHKPVASRRWFHVAATYSGKTMVLYVEQAKVAVSHKQIDSVSAGFFDKCKALELGGNSAKSIMFRGTIDNVRIWSRAKSQTEIKKHLFESKMHKMDSISLLEDFDKSSNRNLGLQYNSVTSSLPELVPSTVPEDTHHLIARKPLCGNTVCDNPEIVRSYMQEKTLRPLKTLRYRLINVVDDNGQNPLVTRVQIKQQHQGINEVFSKYNITWDLTEKEIRNTSLRRRTVLHECETRMIGDSKCHKQCRYHITGNDGGDCDGKKMACEPSKRGNGICDFECNRYYHMWDGGDCCNPKVTDTAKTCVDPNSPYRAYLSVTEYKALINLDNSKYLNIFAVKWTRPEVYGLATFPWDKEVYTVQGGTMLSADRYGKAEGGIKDCIHELGHNLGLWHVFRGVTELTCTDECFETHASMELGDLCSDTQPTPEHTKCRDPDDSDNKCGHGKYTKTPYDNYMSYASGNCANHFTPQQVARMHCYIDMAYQIWHKKPTGPSGIPLPPRILGTSGKRLSIGWLSPIGSGQMSAFRLCHQCESGKNVFRQFAVTAFSSTPPYRHWRAELAIGTPDATSCAAEFHAWVASKSPCNNCYIDLGFEKPVIPTAIKIWIVFNAKDGVTDIQLFHLDGTVTSLGGATGQCDEPFTRKINTDRKTNKVRLYVTNGEVAIDAVQLESEVNHPQCKKCQPMEYVVARDPPFASGPTRKVTKNRMHDNDIKANEAYEYKVKATYGGYEGPWSAPLKVSASRGYCGDGRIDKENQEECDDGNVRDGDGCNIKCKKEDVFHCNGQPSLCYRHERDGMCEDFERATSIHDCGFYTPPGFVDQWAKVVIGNPKYHKKKCTPGPDIITGPPPLDLKCLQTYGDFHRNNVWRPCKNIFSDADHWIEATFEHEVVAAAVILYIGSDGKNEYSRKPRSVKVTLIDSKGNFRGIGRDSVELSCNLNPIRMPVLHDMTKPFFRSKKVRISFSTAEITIAAVTLRSSADLDPIIAANCETMELYNHQTQKCYPYKCQRPFCKPLLLKHANIKCDGQQDGDSCHVACFEGYLPREPFEVSCVVGEWKKVRECKPVNCGKPNIKLAIPECKEGTTLGKKCTFKCKEPATMIGKDNQITCLTDGLWSKQNAYCHRHCPPFYQVPNSTPIDHLCNGKDRKSVKLNERGTECKFRCFPGYYPKQIPPKVAGDLVVVICDVDGKWRQDSICHPVVCPKLSLFQSLVYNCTIGNHYGSVCRTTCPEDGSLQEVRCQSNGEWSSTLKLCKYKGSCGKIKTLANVSVESCSSDNPGSTCMPKCIDDNQDLVVEGKEESAVPPTLVCLPDLSWYPHPGLLKCVRKCEKDNIGDNICDCVNNNKHCKYDGGDCCGHQVAFFQSDRRCPCVDPRAAVTSPAIKATKGPDSWEASGSEPSDDDGSDDVSEPELIPTVS